MCDLKSGAQKRVDPAWRKVAGAIHIEQKYFSGNGSERCAQNNGGSNERL